MTTDLLKRIHNLQNSSDIITAGIKATKLLDIEIKKNEREKIQKNPKKSYNPNANTLKKMKTPSPIIVLALEHLSPFLIYKTNSKDNTRYKVSSMYLQSAIHPLIQLKMDKIPLMTTEKKNEVLEAILEGVSATLRSNKDCILGSGFMLEETFLEQRLTLAFNGVKEPTVFNNEDFDKIESIFLNVLRKEISIQLGLGNLSLYSPLILSGTTRKNSFKYELLNECLKHFEIHDQYFLDLKELYENYLLNGNKLTENETCDFKQLVRCPLAYLVTGTKGDEIPSISDIYHFHYVHTRIEKLGLLIDDIYALTTPEVFLIAANRIITYIEMVTEEINSLHSSSPKPTRNNLLFYHELIGKLSSINHYVEEANAKIIV